MQTILVVLHVFLSVGLIGLILMQHGKGADAGAAFGSGASGTVFGAQGSANFLSRSTAVIAALFFVTSLTMAWFAMQSIERPGLMEEEAVEQPAPVSEVPAVTIPGQEETTESIPVPAVPMGTEEKPQEVPKQ